jgi:hypothetical protein
MSANIQNEDESLLKKKDKSKGESPMTITLPNKELDARVEESFKNIPAIQGTDKNILKI